MGNQWVINWLVIEYHWWSMRNRWQKISWSIDYWLMSLIIHCCYWLLIDYLLITINYSLITHILLWFTTTTITNSSIFLYYNYLSSDKSLLWTVKWNVHLSWSIMNSSIFLYYNYLSSDKSLLWTIKWNVHPSWSTLMFFLCKYSI